MTDPIVKAGKQLVDRLRKAEPAEVQALLDKAGITDPVERKARLRDAMRAFDRSPVDAAALAQLQRAMAADITTEDVLAAMEEFSPQGQREAELLRARPVILERLTQLERKRKVRVLFAIESGSRSWGFASADSDFDARFVYLNGLDDYLLVDNRARIPPMRDVIENDSFRDQGEPAGLYDYSGWDLRKFFALMLKSNPGVYEWLGSNLVYYESNPFWAAVREVAATYFEPRAALQHYVSMAKHNYREHMQGGVSATVKLKKYLYITRPLLCCQAVLESGLPPPMPFTQVVNMAQRGPNKSHAVQDALMDLVRRKQAGDELMEGPVIPEINAWIDAELPRLQFEADRLPKPEPRPTDALDFLFATAARLQEGGLLEESQARYHAALDRGQTTAQAAQEAKP